MHLCCGMSANFLESFHKLEAFPVVENIPFYLYNADPGDWRSNDRVLTENVNMSTVMMWNISYTSP